MSRVTMVVCDLGWVDSDLRSSTGCQAATVATFCPGSIVEHPISMSTQLRSQTIMVTLYLEFGQRAEIVLLYRVSLDGATKGSLSLLRNRSAGREAGSGEIDGSHR